MREPLSLRVKYEIQGPVEKNLACFDISWSLGFLKNQDGRHFYGNKTVYNPVIWTEAQFYGFKAQYECVCVFKMAVNFEVK